MRYPHCLFRPRGVAPVALLLALVALIGAPAFGGSRGSKGAVLTLTPDHNSRWQYRLDQAIHREVIARNTGDALGTWWVRPSLGGGRPGFPICMPQPGGLFLAPGESERIECGIVFDVAVVESEGWRLGQKYSVPLLLSFFDHNAAPGETPMRTLTLDNTVTVTQPGAGLPGRANGPPNAPLAHTNAAIAGRVIDARTRRPLRSAQLQVDVNYLEAQWMHTQATDAAGAFRLAVEAHRRPFFGNWEQYAVTVRAPGYATAHALVTPHPGRTASVTVAVHRPTAHGSYRLVATFDTGGPTARIAVSADGRYAAVSPYTDHAFPASHAYLDFFDTHAATRLWHYPLGGVVHDVDVSDDGQYVAAPYPGPNASIDPTGAPNLVLLDRAGAVVWKRTVFGESPTATIYGQQVMVGSAGPTAVKFSHDARWLAYGTGSGQLVVIDRATQAVRWRDFLRDQVRAISWSGGDARIYASSGDNDVYALDAATGTVLWRTDVGGWSIAWAASKHYLLANAKQGYAITAVRLPDGSVAWRYPSVETSYGLAISPDESAFASVNATNTAPGTVLFDRRGRLLWAVPEQGNAVAFSGNSRYLLTEANTGNPRGAPDRLDLYSAKTGELVWSRPLPDRSTVWNGGSSAVLYLSNDASTILAGNPDGGFVYFFKGRVTPRK